MGRGRRWLPSSLRRQASDRVADRFEQWVRDYQPAADMAPERRDHAVLCAGRRGMWRFGPGTVRRERGEFPLARADVAAARDAAKIGTLPRMASTS